MTKEQIRLLIVEDDPDDAELLLLELDRCGFDVDSQRVQTEPDLVAALERSAWDIIISDFAMPSFNGLRAFEIAQRVSPSTPFIFVSGAIGEDRAVEAMRAGARDYLLKGKLGRLGVAVSRELASAEARRMENAARAHAETERRRLSMAVAASGAAVFEYRLPLDETIHLSDRFGELFGQETIQRLSSDPRQLVGERLHPDDLDRTARNYQAFLNGDVETYQDEFRVLMGDDELRHVAIYATSAQRDGDGVAKHVVGVVLDQDERKRLEEQLVHAQKMEAVGRLAGGVAHDFNNLLTVILSFGELALDRLDHESFEHEAIGEVLRAADRAAGLTNQLLAFSRRAPIAPRALDLNSSIRNTERMLSRLLGESIDLEVSLEPELKHTMLDPTAFEQILINLAVNARDAMPGGGLLKFESRSLRLSESRQLRSDTIPAGEYVVVTVEDDGNGMTPSVAKKAFEPFFTTKGVGKGTGLGLATCLGVIQQAGGWIEFETAEDAGTRFELIFPAIESTESQESPRPPVRAGGHEAILVAEDDPQLRRLVVYALANAGYEVTAGGDGDAALNAYRDAGTSIDLLVTDVVMPGMSGRDLAEVLRAELPSLRVLFISGYTDDILVGHGVVGQETSLLMKPFNPDELLDAVRTVLDAC